jgi:hypothetical protein
MSDITLNGSPVIRGDLKEPYDNAWTAELDLDADAAPSGAVSLSVLGTTFTGTVVSDPNDPELKLSGESGGFFRCRIVGGAGGLTKQLQADELAQGALISAVLQKILAGSGERLSPEIDPQLLGRAVPQWSWTTGTVGGALAALVQYLGGGIVWRIRRDGLVWLGVPTPTAVAPPDYIVTDIAPEAGQASWALNDLSAQLDHTIDGLTLRQIVWQFTPGELNALVTFAPGPVNALYGLFGQWLRRVGLDYFRPTAGRIAAQNADGSMKVQPDDSGFSPFRRVGQRLGLPDSEVSGASGRCIVGWEGAAPASPVLLGFSQSRATKIKIGMSSAGPPAGTQPLVTQAMRTAQQALDQSLGSALTSASGALNSAAAALNSAGTAPNFTAAQTFFSAAGAALGTAGSQLGSASAAVQTFENAAASNSNFVTKILEGG